MTEQASSLKWRTGPEGASSIGSLQALKGRSRRGKKSNKVIVLKKTQPVQIISKNSIKKALPKLEAPMHSLDYLQGFYYDIMSSEKIKQPWIDNPKSQLENYVFLKFKRKAMYEDTEGFVDGRRDSSIRSQVVVDEVNGIIAYGDAKTKKEAEKLAALDAIFQLVSKDLIGPQAKKKVKDNMKDLEIRLTSDVPTPTSNAASLKEGTALLSDGSVLTAARATSFLHFYCSEFGFGRPDANLKQMPGYKNNSYWDAEMRVGGAKIGLGQGRSKKQAMTNVYLDTVKYLESADPQLWLTFAASHRPGPAITVAAPVTFLMSEQLDDDMMKLYDNVRRTHLFANRPRLAGHIQSGEVASNMARATPIRLRSNKRYDNDHNEECLQRKSMEMLTRLKNYQVDPRWKDLRSQRCSLPVQQMASDVLVKVEMNQVIIVMAATGSGKTTQLPQMILDNYIMQGEGARCNIIVTQPRRIAAISVAERVASERGEPIGQTVGYAVRFEQRPPQKHGSILFCTTGHFLRRLQAAMTDEDREGYFDEVTHIIVDEVHERDIETDILLIVLRRIMAERKMMKKREIKVILMSATIDPTLFCNYFTNPNTTLPAPIVDIPGRNFSVQRHYLDEIHVRLKRLNLTREAGGWIWEEKNVKRYLDRELTFRQTRYDANASSDDGDIFSIDPIELPYPFIALMIADIIVEFKSGDILVFLPGWEDIKSLRRILEETRDRPMMGIDFTKIDRYEIHALHSNIPIQDQRAILEPPYYSGVRRIILATNIAETSITIPNIVFVIDSGKAKENHYDPNRHLQSLVSTWVGISNVNQRAGRAGRHCEGHAYSLMTRARHDSLKPSSIVAMKRENLSNIVLNIKGMKFGEMDVEELLAEAIEPPPFDRVRAAVENLIDLGALDMKKELTSLGQILSKLPTDASIGKMCLYGVFFRCLDSTLSLAAIMTERSPWLMTETIRDQAIEVKQTWSHPNFPSDALATLRALKKFEELSFRGSIYEVNKFCSVNFLHRGAMQTMLQIKEQLFETLRAEGVLFAVLSPKGEADSFYQQQRRFDIHIGMPELNINSTSLPLLTALIAMSSTPKFAMRIKEKIFRTNQDKTCFIENSSVCRSKASKEQENTGERDLFAYQTKTSLNSSDGDQKAPPILRGITLVDPLVYMLFGASRMSSSREGGMICDDWIPLCGDINALINVERLKELLDACMHRVFEAIDTDNVTSGTITHRGSKGLNEIEAEEFGLLTKHIIQILEQFSEERLSFKKQFQNQRQEKSSYPTSSFGVGLL